MSIMDLFRAPVATPAATQSQTLEKAGQQQETQQTQQTQQQPPVTKTEPESPLAQYTDLWKIDATKKPADEPLFNVDPTKLHEAAAQTDFTKVITPELRQKLAAGGDEAITASIEAMNKIAQANFAQSAFATTKIVEQVVDKLTAKHEAQIAEMLKQSKVSDSLNQNNPQLEHPAIAPLVNAMKQQFMEKYPNATPTQISEMTRDYFQVAAKVFTPESSTPVQHSKEEYDWSKFL